MKVTRFTEADVAAGGPSAGAGAGADAAQTSGYYW